MHTVKRARHLKKIFKIEYLRVNSFSVTSRRFSRNVVLNTEKDEFLIKSFLPDVKIPEVFLERVWKDSASFKNHVAIVSKNIFYYNCFYVKISK